MKKKCKLLQKIRSVKRKKAIIIILAVVCSLGFVFTTYASEIIGTMENTIKRELGYVSDDVSEIAVAETDDGYLSIGYTTSGVDDIMDNSISDCASFLTKTTESSDDLSMDWEKSFYIKSFDSSLEMSSSTEENEGIKLLDMTELSDGSYVMVGFMGLVKGVDYIDSDSGTYTCTVGSVTVDSEGNVSEEETYDVDFYVSADDTSSMDAIIIVVDADGNVEYIQTMEGYSNEEITSVCALSDGGFAVVGYTGLDADTDEEIDAGDFEGTAEALSVSGTSAFIAEYSQDYDLEWISLSGGESAGVYFNGVTETSDGNLAITGYQKSESTMTYGDGSTIVENYTWTTVTDLGFTTITKTHCDSIDSIAGLVDSDGNIQWIDCIGGSDEEVFCGVVADDDGGFYVSGVTNSEDGDFEDLNNGSYDAVLAYYDEDGTLNWLKTYGGSQEDYFNAIDLSYEGGLVVTGMTLSSDGDLTDTAISGGADIMIVNIDSDGNIWRVTPLGGTGDDETAFFNVDTSPYFWEYGSSSILSTLTGYVVAGMSYSTDSLFVTDGSQTGVLGLASYDYDCDGVPDSMDYYPSDDTKYEVTEDAVDLTEDAVVTFGDSSSDTCEISMTDLLTEYTDDDGDLVNIMGTDNVTIEVSGGSITIPAQYLFTLLYEQDDDDAVLTFSIGSVDDDAASAIESLEDSDQSSVLSVEVTLTTDSGEELVDLPSDALITVDIPDGVSVSCESGLTLQSYDSSTGELEDVDDSDIELTDDDQITFTVDELSTYVVTDTLSGVTNLKTKSNTASSIQLSWTASEGATSYKVYQYYDGAWHYYKTTSNTFIKITGLSSGTKYRFKVCAYNADTETSSSYTYYTAKTKLTKVTDLTTASNTSSSIKLSWSAVDGATKYQVYYYKNGSWHLYKTTSKTTINVKGLSAGTKYKFRVRAYSSSSKSYSNYTTYTAKTRPANVKSLKVKAKTSSTVTLSWSKASGANRYKVYYYSNGSWHCVKTTSKTTAKITGLKSGKTYKIRIRSYNKNTKTYSYSYKTITVKTK